VCTSRTEVPDNLRSHFLIFCESSKHPTYTNMVFRASLTTAAIIACATSTAASTDLGNATTSSTGVRSLIAFDQQTYSYCGVDLVGGDTWIQRYPDPDSCVTNCLPEKGCNAATWTDYEGGTCYFKRLQGSWSSTDYPRVNAVPKLGAASFLREKANGAPAAVPATVPDVDMPGNDIGSYQTDDVRECEMACEKNTKCFAFTWTPYNGGTCWLKSKASPYVSSPGAKSLIWGRNIKPNVCVKAV
jgi:hypothetical protein